MKPQIGRVQATLDDVSKAREAAYESFLDGDVDWEDTLPMLDICDQYVIDATNFIKSMQTFLNFTE